MPGEWNNINMVLRTERFLYFLYEVSARSIILNYLRVLTYLNVQISVFFSGPLSVTQLMYFLLCDNEGLA